MTEELDVQQLWQQAQDMLRAGEINRALWDAAAAVQPITIDADTLILGLPSGQMQHASYLETAANKTRLQQILESLAGRRLDLRVISGTTQEAWQRLQQREQAVAETTVSAARTRAAGQTAINIWREGGQQINQIFTGARARARSIDLAQLLTQALPLIWETEQKARQQDPEAQDLHSRQLDRILDRIATYCNVPGPVVALEYLRYRSAQDKT